MKTPYILLLYFLLLCSSIGNCQTVKTNEPIKQNSQNSSFKKLYEELHKAEYYTKSEQEFYQQFGTPEGQQKLYKALNDAGYYTKSLNEFKEQFFDKEIDENEDTVSIRSFKSGETVYDVPVNDVQTFLNELPDAQEIRSFILGKDTFDIPIDSVSEFLKDAPNAKELHSYTADSHNFIQIQKEINSNLKLYNNLLNSKRISVDELGDFDSFSEMLSDKNKAIQFYKKLIKKGFTVDEIGTQIVFLENINQNSRISQPTTSFQIDKIKVGDANIELPVPSGFVKVDDSMGNLLKIAKKLIPETNTLLAYYISDEDYANYLVDENYICEKYILIEVFNEVKDIKVGAKDYRQFLKTYKQQYIDEFKMQMNDAELKASENISEIDESIKMKDFKTMPFGVSYESKYSLSYGIISKYQLSVNNAKSDDYIVAALATITKIDSKPIFLFLYKMYNGSEDIVSLKALNSSWLKEIEKRQKPGSFLRDIDFKDYKESILAILTLSFIWAIYFATKKIHRKIKVGSETKVIKDDEMKEFLDFNELLNEDKKINDEPEIEENVLESKTNEEIKSNSFIVVNPELLKVNRRTRFYNWLIDAVLFYFIIYLPLFYYNTVSNYYLYLVILFLYYFIQEFLFGKTIGKFITKTYVINSLGVKPTILQLILRNASRLIPFEAITYLSKEKRGLHDIFSKTYVIKD